MTQRSASCSCGQLVLAIEGDPVRVSICHCLACQRRTGSVFGVQARFHASQVAITGQSSEYVRTGDGGGRTRFHFCPSCGSTVYYRIGGSGDFIAVPVGAFADPAFPAPAVSVYEERQHAWVRVPDDVEHHA
jgi:hypothetical protein